MRQNSSQKKGYYTLEKPDNYFDNFDNSFDN